METTKDYNIKTNKSSTFSISLSSANPQGKLVTIDFDNGNIASYSLNSTPKIITTTYIDSSEKYITITNADIISTLTCNDMNISELNLSALTNIEKLICYNNNILTLDFSNNSNIKYIHCFNNPLISDDTALLNMINTLPDRNNKAYGSIIIDNRAQMLKVEPTSIQKDWLFGSAIMYNPTEWAKCGYHFKQTGVADIWESGDMGEGVTISVIDCGFDLRCQEYDTNSIKGIYNFSNQGSYNEVPLPLSGTTTHGNSTSNLIIAKGVKMYGIAPKAQLLLLKASDSTSICYTNWVSSAINYALQKNVDLITMSLSFPAPNSTLESTVKNYCLGNSKRNTPGYPLVCSAGNTGDNNAATNDLRYPGAYKYPIAVGAINSSNSMTSWSSSYLGVDVVSYGAAILTQTNYNSYASINGTSFSTPITAGILALLINIFKKKNGRKPTSSELYSELIKRTIALNVDYKLSGVGRIMLTAFNSTPTQIPQI